MARFLLATNHLLRYCSLVTANSVIGFGDSSNLAHKRPITNSWRFFCACSSCFMVAVCGRPLGLPDSKFPVRQPAHSCHPKSFGDDPRQLQTKLGATPMTTLLIPVTPAITSTINRTRAAAHRAMAAAALRSDSSLGVRLARYNSHMTKARAIAGGAL